MTINPPMSGLRILITNDDSINANGIKALERIANSITPDVWVVAPEVGQSGKGYSVTFDSILKIKELSPRRFSVSGTPADCVFIALGEILKDKKPDLVLSGINHGANVANFIGLSGTVGAAFAAISQNVKAVAVSQDCNDGDPLLKFPLIDHYLPTILKKLLSFEWPKKICMNVNFPMAQLSEICGVKIASQGELEVLWNVFKKANPSDQPYYWLRSSEKDKIQDPDSDLVLLKQKAITITALQSYHQFSECNAKLKELFDLNV